MSNDFLIERALREGGNLHAFRSGGGLRVVRVEVAGRLVAYGEAPHIEEAMRIVAEDYAAGGRQYDDVYGKFEPHYLTGANEASGRLDAWIRAGQTFDAWAVDGGFAVRLKGWKKHETPKDIMTRAIEGESVQWTDERGCVFASYRTAFANGDLGCATECVSRPDGISQHDVWMWDWECGGHAPKLERAIDLAMSKVER